MSVFLKLFHKNKFKSDCSGHVNTCITEEIDGGRIEEIPKIQIPPYQGDYAKAVFLYAYAKASPVKENIEYQRYIIYECGIRNPSDYHKKLIQEGYLVKPSNKDLLNSFKLSEIKDFLREKNLSISGKKEDLVLRLLEVIDDDFMKNHTNTNTYSISDKGKAFLEENRGYIFIHKHKNWQITWQQYDELRKDDNNVNDVIWKILNDRIIRNGIKDRNSYFDMYQLLVEENRREEALQMLLRVIYLDVSGIDGLYFIEQYKSGYLGITDARENFECSIILAPGILKHVSDFSDIYNDGYVDHLYEWILPIQLCDKNQFKTFIHSLIDGSYNEDEFMKKLKNSYYKVLRECK